MPQLTLFADGSKSIGLSPSRPKASSSRAPRKHLSAYAQKGPEAELSQLHREQEDMAAASKTKRKAKEGGTEVHMRDEADRPKGLPAGKKREGSDEPEGGGVAGREAKKFKNAYEIRGKVATAEAAAAVDANPPLEQLMQLQKATDRKPVEKGESVVYWMRMEDMRIEDNTALAHASACAKQLGIPLLCLFVLSPGDYKWHDRSARRIDFVLRNLRWLKTHLAPLNIPIHIVSFDRRLSIPKKLVSEVFPHLRTHHVFANIEYEVDELRRDIATVKMGRDRGIDVVCVHDRLVVPPGRVTSKQGKPMSVFSPWQRTWARLLDEEPSLLDMAEIPNANDMSVRDHELFGKLFDAQVPDHVEDFIPADAEKMKEVWPEGTDRAKELLDRFLHTKARRKQLELTSPLTEGAELDEKHSRISDYMTGRNLVDGDNSSRLSPYLVSGVISGRMVINAAKKMGKGGKLESGRDTGIGMWVQEVAWRDFYNHVMSTWPRISMGRPFLENFADVQWEVDEEHLQAWKDGKTGYPIVDAAMRACNQRGWMENRVRMVSACFLVKDLMLDWRLGERYFMQCFIDGDLAANNGGWQWTASTGTDPQPYFRIFNTLTQSEKCDPYGDYIRYWVPELRNLKGKAVHDPYNKMPSNEFKKLGYPAPIVDHKKARERALFRYKNVGEKEP